jgi:hypothetical protein
MEGLRIEVIAISHRQHADAGGCDYSQLPLLIKARPSPTILYVLTYGPLCNCSLSTLRRSPKPDTSLTKCQETGNSGLEELGWILNFIISILSCVRHGRDEVEDSVTLMTILPSHFVKLLFFL